MGENKTNLKDLNEEQKLQLIEQTELNVKLLDAQARLAEARARIAKASVEEIAYLLQGQQLRNPPKSKEDESKPNAEEGQPR